MTLLMSRRILFPALLASLFATSAIACSSGEDTKGVSDDGQPDASAPDAVSPNEDEDAAAPDGSARPDSSAEPPRTCSDDNICHTALPPKSFLRDVWSAGDGVVWAVGWKDKQLLAADGVILRWDGTSWTAQHKVPLRLNAVWGSSPTDIWVGGDSGLFHGTGPSSAQITWTKVRSEPIVSIWGSSANDVWAVGHTRTWKDFFDGQVLHYRGPSADGGDGWEIDPLSSRPAAYRKVWGTSAQDVWIGGSEFSTCGYDFCNGSRAFALHRDPDGDGGFTWSEAGADFVGIEPGSGIHRGSEFSGGGSIGSSNVWLMGSKAPKTPIPTYDALFIGSKDGAGDYTWSEGTFGTSQGGRGDFGLWFNRAVWGKTPNDVYLAGDFGQLRHWNGTDFSLVKTTIDAIPVTAAFHAMWGSSSTDLWIVGDEIALHKVSPTKL
ncbi:MAG: hypothetical protein BGO98_41670 [Myxococcales bacterium 68-20]|nr:MAG: hypothetical protein BGO98_41670 [Myxococcales bacterium 68-20]